MAITSDEEWARLTSRTKPESTRKHARAAQPGEHVPLAVDALALHGAEPRITGKGPGGSPG